MIVIIEGSDLSGKTTAIEKIAKHFNSGFVIKNSYKPRKPEDSIKLLGHYWHLINIVSTCEEHDDSALYIFDRFYPSQAVYSYLRGIDEIDHIDIKHLDKYCSELQVKMIYLDTPLKDLKERFKKRGDEHVKEDMLEKIKLRYQVFLGLTKLEVLKLDTRKDNWMKRVEDFLK